MQSPYYAKQYLYCLTLFWKNVDILSYMEFLHKKRNTSFVADKKPLTILCSSIAKAYRFLYIESVEAELSVSIISIVYSAALIFLASFSLKIKWHLSGFTFIWLSVNHWNKKMMPFLLVLKSHQSFAAYGGQYNCVKIWCYVRNKSSMAILKKWV